jgi:hypothetical protein
VRACLDEGTDDTQADGDVEHGDEEEEAADL